jgi:DNA (cytosine-5)-methyltransferase 1
MRKLQSEGGALTHFSLFSGIGGIDLAAEWAGFKTVGQCEFADYPTKVLQKHWPDTPRWRDVRDVTGNALLEKSISEITLLSGGFPCQPHSLSGKRLASCDERDLWGEFARIIREARPRWVLGENVRGLLSSEDGRFFGRILRDLAGLGYDASWGVLSAFHAGAVHRRERVFIVAHAHGRRRQSMEVYEQAQCDPDNFYATQPQQAIARSILSDALRVLSEPGGRLHRNDDGLPEALDRLKCHGNAVMPQQVYPILAAVAAVERSLISDAQQTANY